MNQEQILKHTRSAAFGALLFLGFMLAGSGYIVHAKLTNVDARVVTAVPLALMLSYAAILFLARYFRLRDDQAGDNLYYLGFLYTLTSLGVSLWQFSVNDGGAGIVTNFGIAIASTILGVALRVVFNQMRQDPVEVERLARLELADAARKVKQELDGAAFEFASFRRSTQQMLDESILEKREMGERLAKALFEGLAEIPARTAEPITAASLHSKEVIEKLAHEILDEIRSAGQKLSVEESNLANSTAEVSTSLQQLQTRLKSMQGPEEIIEIKLQPFTRGLTKALKDSQESTDAQLTALREVIERFDTSVQGLSANMSAAGRDRAADQQAMRELSGKVSANNAETQRLLGELARRTAPVSAMPVAAVPAAPRPEVARGWFFNKGTPS
jgi:chaperonin cofactor prefoldin